MRVSEKVWAQDLLSGAFFSINLLFLLSRQSLMQRRLALNSPVAEDDLELLTLYILLLGGVILGEHSHT